MSLSIEERSEIRPLFWRRPGSLAIVAKEIGLTPPQLAQWFRGKRRLPEEHERVVLDHARRLREAAPPAAEPKP